MKKHGGLTRKNEILLHMLQQFMAFLLVGCIMILLTYSVVGVRTETDSLKYKHTFGINLFSEAEKFDETDTFDRMLMSALQEIIRYNVAKSQLETDGQFDGDKVIDVRDFANRKNSLTKGMEDLFLTDDTVTAKYYLKDLLKWEKYGLSYESVILTEEEFVTLFGTEKLYLYDGILTEEQKETLQEYLSGVRIPTESEELVVLETTDDADTADSSISIMDDMELLEKESVLDENGTEEKQLGVYTQNQIHQALLDIVKNSPEMIGSIYAESTGEIYVQIFLLQDRYKTTDNRTLLSIAESWKDYVSLVMYVEQTTLDLSYNYGEYQDFKERYETGATNIVYVFNMTMMGESVSVSNLADFAEPEDRKKVSVADMDSFFRNNYGRYIIYRPQTMTFESNTGIIKESGLFDAFSDYEYAYPETAEIWLAVDTAYPAQDSFCQAAEMYETMRPFAHAVCAVAIVSGICWIVLFLYLSVMSGYRKKNEEESLFELHWFDYMYTEIAMLLGILACGLMILGVEFLYNILAEATFKSRMEVVLLSGIGGMVYSVVFCVFWYSFLRRIKGKVLFRGSLLYLVWKGIIVRPARALKKSIQALYGNSGMVVRCILPAGICMAGNFIWGIMARDVLSRGSSSGFWFMIFLVCMADQCFLGLWCMNYLKRKKIIQGIGRIRDGELDYQVPVDNLYGENKELAEAVNSIGEGIQTAVATSMKDERLKADLITNVSHDIKTPLTSIINYVDLLKRENIEDEPVKGYIAVLDAKSQRLKQLTDDLVEASKISSGNITLLLEKINLTELVKQALGEFSEKFEEKGLETVLTLANEPVIIEADSRRIWRVAENLLNNIYKYAMPGTRIYLDMTVTEDKRKAVLSFKNISAQRMNIRAEELTERFIRGDVSRSTEGSGLGLSIAKNLTELQKGSFEIYLDGDLFKVTLTFPLYGESTEE